jgi:Flp pilus assembly protein TadG
MKVVLRKSRGQVGVLYAMALIGLLGGVAMCTDVGVMYLNWHRMQRAVDAAALAGVTYLPEDTATAISTAETYGEDNGLAASEIAPPLVGAGANGIDTLTVSATRNVPYYFARVLGMTTQKVSVTAVAEAPAPASSVQCGSSASAGYGSTVGECGLIPIGVDNSTTYSYLQSVTLNEGQVGPGDWGSLALGSNGGNVLRSNIANGYDGLVSVGNVLTEPGKAVGPVDQGFMDRINAGLSSDPSGTAASHTANDPRVVIVPLVNWSSAQGKGYVTVTGFAALWIDSVAGGTIQANFISTVAPNGTPDPSLAYTGPLGQPRLIE